jgi:peptidoglycan/xylan/chitin deacetylase (PgdA/CDA1 family)
MGWDELKELHQSGMVIGSHGFSHEILTGLLDTQIEEELQASKKYLERNLGIAVDTLSIPRGFCDDNVIQKAYAAGYKRIFISDRPRKLQSDCYSRLAVKANWPLKRFKQALEGNMPFYEKIIGTSKSALKRLFGSSVYNWIRRTILKI